MPAYAVDGSSTQDAPTPVVIDTRDPAAKWRYGCPHGHTSIEPSNGGIWCRSCANAFDIEDPHHHEVLDKKTDETIPWHRVRLTP